MVVTIYNNKSDNNVIKKNIQELFNINCTFKDDVDIINPTLIIDYDSRIFNANYIYIPDLKRYYFITNIELSQQKIYITCSVDVLKSFQDEILSLSAVIKRQEKRYNTYLNDEKFKAYENSYVHTLTFPYGFSSQSFILSICGGGD